MRFIELLSRTCLLIILKKRILTGKSAVVSDVLIAKPAILLFFQGIVVADTKFRTSLV